MLEPYKVSLKKIMEKLSLGFFFSPISPDKVKIISKNVSRLSFELDGFLDYFDKNKLLIFGKIEQKYLLTFSSEERFEAIDRVFAFGPPALIFARNLYPSKEVLKSAKKNGVHLISSSDEASVLLASLVSFLNFELANLVLRHGVFVEVYGEGILIFGKSGIGKSEVAVELVQRGHRLVADDLVEIKRVSKSLLVGCAPKNIRHFMEIRGIGIINVRELFGTGSVREKEEINLVLYLDSWDDWEKDKSYDRMGVESQYTKILDVIVPTLRIPVRPGRSLAVIVEIAAMNLRQKKVGGSVGGIFLGASKI
ncbi:MAG: HPr(Ser) kinase/phosphatase [Oscillospiraceae bacterium]|jgi:HPr kinase/phosphorylase|nr:HPr(Ser) kinase/phosphatase [Oscillospiraceae bacterium]